MHMILYNLTYMILYDINTPLRLLGVFSNEFVNGQLLDILHNESCLLHNQGEVRKMGVQCRGQINIFCLHIWKRNG